MAMMYMVKRGAPINFMDVKKPSATSWSTPVDALVLTLRREKTLTEKINQLARHSIKEHHDPNLFAFLMNNVVDAQSEHVFEAAAYIHKMEKGGPKFGLMAMNRQMVTKYRNFLDCESDAEKYKWNY
ncbi:uncharacterized protein LOC135474879 [Liolophura sinensis]|uniref:uncharacterized protein LOC135474879 n=1 Tax=Liolophura sinensis TaxID=3198878 RepID=UPI003158E9F4